MISHGESNDFSRAYLFPKIRGLSRKVLSGIIHFLMARRQFEPLSMDTWGTGMQGPLGRGKIIEILFLFKINNQNVRPSNLLSEKRPSSVIASVSTCNVLPLSKKLVRFLQISHNWFCLQPALEKSKSVPVAAPI